MRRMLLVGAACAACLLLPGLSPPVSAIEATETPDPVGVWPLRPEPDVVRPFEQPPHPYAAGHRGVDLLGVVGQSVHAALPGTVSFTGSIAGRGVVVVDHGATRTTYEPVAAEVAAGDPVAAGGVLGTLTPTQSHCLPAACLHWGWIEGDTYLDPLRLVGLGPVRLLPLWQAVPSAPGPSLSRGTSAGSAAATGLGRWF